MDKLIDKLKKSLYMKDLKSSDSKETNIRLSYSEIKDIVNLITNKGNL